MKANLNPVKEPSPRWEILSLFGVKPKRQPAISVPHIEPEPAPSKFISGRRILVVDDDPVVLKATETRLKAHGLVVSTATDGSGALEAVRTERPDLILLDLAFPPEPGQSWDGFTIMDWLTNFAWFRNTPVIICTGSNEEDLLARAGAAGAAGLFHKPLDYKSLLGLIEFHLKPKLTPQSAQINGVSLT